MVLDLLGTAAVGAKGLTAAKGSAAVASKGILSLKTAGVSTGSGSGFLASPDAAAAVGSIPSDLVRLGPLDWVPGVDESPLVTWGTVGQAKAASLFHGIQQTWASWDRPGSIFAAMKEAPLPLIATCIGMRGIRRMGYITGGDEESDDEDGRRGPGVQKQTGLRLLPPALKACAFNDMFVATALLQSWSTALPVPLQFWAAGGLLLSFPASRFVAEISDLYGVRYAFSAEVGVSIVSFAWVSYGTYMLGTQPGVAAAAHAPLLWWTSFAQCCLAWSGVTTSIFMMVALTVASVMMSGTCEKNNRKNERT
eukprot:TRINITY_DN6990_c0_g1_i2.p1 TRINITY_DN6990_c0_g1~~TRINITY_DN6990_c0_g1_i2.p1  ORF type:complete len:309 (+),score=49.06 TRINITY_DN6990_c0_g1_i2:113-1039(+)